MNRLIIIGAGGHGRVIAENAERNGYTDICFVDDNAKGECLGFPIIGTSSDIESLNDGKTDFIIGIGCNAVRKSIAEKYDVNWVTIIHPSAHISKYAKIGKGTIIMAGAVINTCASVGNHCIINTTAVVEHDNTVCDFVHISPGAKLSGTVYVGNNTWVGTGSSVKHDISICDDVVVGAGSVVVNDIKKKGTHYGTI